jgi:hypothetical protein
MKPIINAEIPERYAIRYWHSRGGIDRAIIEELGAAEAKVRELEQALRKAAVFVSAYCGEYSQEVTDIRAALPVTDKAVKP